MARIRPQSAPEALPEPRIDDIIPAAALPLGEIELIGAHLGPDSFGNPPFCPPCWSMANPPTVS